MKSFLNTAGFVLALLFLAANSSAQTLNLNCESGNRATEQANCWGFGAVTYTNTPANIVAGAWSARSNSMSNSSPNAAWIKSPWLKPGSGNITFKAKLENTTGTSGNGAFKAVRLRFITYDSNKSFGEGVILADSFQYTFVAPYTSTVTVSWPIPASIANSGNPYKLMISFLGSGGNNRANFDDLVLPGIYWSDPANNCLPLQLDADNDGIADNDEDYPNDQYRAFNNWFPASGLGTLLFEDLWPNVGDYDLNDLVVDYRFNTVTDALAEVVEIKYTFIIRAVGATRKNGFAFQLDDLDVSRITRVTGAKPNAIPGVALNANGTESGQEKTNIIVVGDVKSGFSLPSAAAFVNVNLNDPVWTKDTINLVVTFKENGALPPGGAIKYTELTPSKFNPYMIIEQERGKEVHLAGREPSDKMNTSYFGQGQDDSSENDNKYFVTANNLPWALNIYSSLPNLVESTDFTQGFVHFSSWAQSGGTQFADWYLDIAGYRNNSLLINR